MKLKVLFLFFLVSYYTSVNAQKLGYSEPAVPSAEVAKLTQFSMSGPNLYTGSGSFSIPIYSLNIEGKEISFSFAYQGGGIRAGENSGIIGLGWTFSIPGNVSRNIQGSDDLSNSATGARNFLGYVYDLNQVPEKLYNPVPTGFNDPYWDYLGGEKKDTEPDIFNYNFLGSSGKFILKKKAFPGSMVEITKLVKNSDKIQFDESTGTIIITTPDGFKGEFSIKEYSTTISGTSPNSSFTYSPSSVDMLSLLKSGARSASSWHLTKIISPKGREVIFNYKVNATTKLSDYLTLGSISWAEERSINSQLVSNMVDVKGWSRVMNEQVYLESVVALDYDLKIELNYATRTDIQKPNTADITENSWVNSIKSDRGNNLGPILDPLRLFGIVIKNNSGSNYFNLSATLYQSYFNSAATDKLNFTRLKLDSVKIGDQVHEFKYNNITHSKSTRGIDYWGFYNGKDSNSEIVPVISTNPPIGAQLISTLKDNYYFQSSNRAADFNYGKAGLLYEVEFPTKGKVVYEYEPHVYKLEGSEIAPPTGSSLSISGLGVAMDSTSFYYSGYGVNQCGAVTVTLKVMCKDFFLGNTCSVDPSDMATNAVEFLSPSGAILASLNFQQLWAQGTNYHEVSYTFPSNPNGSFSSGTYKVRVRSVMQDGVSKYYGDAYISINGNCGGSDPVPIIRNQLAGGARVKSISVFDRYSVLISKTKYLYEDPTFQGVFSSGKLMNPLMHFTQLGSGSINSSGTTYEAGPVHFVHTSGSALSNGQAAQGSHIGYSVVQQVEESNNGLSNGLKVFKFENISYTFQPIHGYYNNFGVARTVLDDVNGFKKGESVFSSTNQAISYEYSEYDFIQSSYLNSLKLYFYGGPKPLVSFYKIPSGLVVGKSSDYYLDGVTSRKTYLYNSSNQINNVKTYDGNFLVEENRFKYPGDFSAGNTVINDLINANIVGVPIESTTYRDGAVIFSEGISFKKEGINMVPHKNFSHNVYQSFVPTTNGVDFAGGYKLESNVNSFDSYGNPKEIVKDGSNFTSLLWDYNGIFLAAVAQNCLSSELAFTSFETSDKGGWSYIGATNSVNSKAGRKSYLLSGGAISKTGIPASSSNKFKVAFWARSTSGTVSVSVGGQTESLTTTWKYVEKIITTTSLSITGTNVLIDDLRLYPIDALVETYTYDQLLGITSKMDAKGLLYLYTYDTYGRLISIKDESGNLLEYFEYNYAIGN
jgi:YD repeat-containing protein